MTGRLRRWEAGVAATVILAVAGLLNRSGVLLLAAVIPLAYVAYGSATSVTVPDGLRATRRVDETPTPPGRPVTVTLEVRNEGPRPLSDVRVIDGVPDALTVVDGTPRAGAAIDVGESTTIEYVVVPRRGEYDFDPPRVRVRGAAAGSVADATVAADGEDRLVCRLDARAPPLADRGAEYVGTLTADDAGRGVEFHSTREYRTGDPASQIDWRHYAKRGELTTVSYARQVAAVVVLVIDARGPCRVVAGPGWPTAVELSAYAATEALTDLLASGHEVAVAVLGLDGPGPVGLHWLPPGSGAEQRSLALDLCRTAIDAEPGTVDATDQVHRLVELAPPGAQLALFTAALDDVPVEAVRAWSAVDHPLVVCSPDVVSDNTAGGQLAGLRRRTRLARCQSLGARTVDWRRGTPLALVLERAFAAEARLATGGARGTTRGGRP